MGSPLALSHLTLIDLEGQSQGNQNFVALYLVNEPSEAICYYLNMNRKSYIGILMAP